MIPNLKSILCFDIETIPAYSTLLEAPERVQELWMWKNRNNANENHDETYLKEAALYAEFNRIVSIAVGYFNGQDFKVKTLMNKDEKALLLEFSAILINAKGKDTLAGHNIIEFDIPVMCRRYLANGLEIPDTINCIGKKPWEVKHIDTMQLWKFGSFKHWVSLDLLCATLDIPSPKADMSGAEVHKYWLEEKFAEIKEYNAVDVVAVAMVLMKMKGEDIGSLNVQKELT